MKFNIKRILSSFALVLLLSGITIQAEVTREHRAIWVSPFLSANWPSGAITSATHQQATLRNRLDQFKKQNINVIYYHARAMCDATYNSAYEPWSHYVSGTRGKAPAYDPFEFLVKEAHARGIEVYAWVNPYRYSNSSANNYSWGSGSDLNYEVSHPDWLIMGNGSKTLNPGLEVVKQRIVDVCKDIITKYDVDGLVFDDYFYPDNGTPTSVDADLYNAYKNSGGTLDQTAWRCENVNEMVRRVMEMIKATKPHVCFGIAPAGVAGANASAYGLPSMSGDWQYGTIHSDPLNWLSNGTIDYISPQIYWPDRFESLSNWWSNAAEKFNRHFYPSTSISDIANDGADAFVQEVLASRNYSSANEAGMAYFEYGKFVSYTENYGGSSNLLFGNILKAAVYQNKVLTPLRSWRNKVNPVMTSNVKLSGTTLSWDNVSGMRYTVYAVPNNISDSEFACQREYLDGIAYTNSYTIPDDKKTGYRWAVAVYDRYGNEYSPLFVGATTTSISAATLNYPINGATAKPLFDFKWTGQGSRNVVEIAEDRSFSNIIGSYETTDSYLSSSVVDLVAGKTYYWRVVSYAPNALPKTSSYAAFKSGGSFSVTEPANGATEVSLTPTIKWSEAESGTSYLVELSKKASMTPLVYTTTVTSTSVTIPENMLLGYTDYYVRVKATKGANSVVSDIISFKTKEMTGEVAAPAFVYPTSNGMTIYSNQSIEVKAWGVFTSVTVKANTSNSFTNARQVISTVLSDGATHTPLLGDGWSKKFTNGSTYYVRAEGTYNTSSGAKTLYSPVMTFVYSSAAGIEDVTTDKAEIYITSDNILMLAGEVASIEIYSVAGQLIESVNVSTSSYDLSGLASGAYLIKVNDGNAIKTLKFVK